ncbi:MAG: DsbA family protein [Pyrinomonadaceae bacterium]
MLRKLSLLIAVSIAAVCAQLALAQTGGTTLATATGFRFTENDLSADGRKLYDQESKLIAENRRGVFNEWVFQQLLETEAKARGLTAEKVEAEALAKAEKPTEVQIKAVYDKNRQNIGSRTLEDVRPNIIEFLQQEAGGKQRNGLFESLKTKYKFTSIKDAGLPLKAADVLGSIGARQITVGEFEMANRIALYNFRANVYEQIRADLENAIFAKLLDAEAKKRNTDASGLIAAEVTNKLKNYSNYEQMSLEDALQDKLFRAFAVNFNAYDIEPQVLNISADDDPSIGPETARVKVVAFVDFQCSACAAFSPLMKQVIAEFGSGVRLVVRDFPLTQIHEHGMDAALAAYAARQQGKFFEMTDLMYRNQESLDAASLANFAKELGLDVERFQRDAHSPAAMAEVNKDVADGSSYGVNGTPAIFVNGVRLQRLTTGRLRAAIQKALT